MIPNGITVPDEIGDEGRAARSALCGTALSREGVLELVEAADGLQLVVAGDGPLRAEVPQAQGFVPPAELQGLYARAAVVVCPSHREGFGVACAEAMAPWEARGRV